MYRSHKKGNLIFAIILIIIIISAILITFLAIKKQNNKYDINKSNNEEIKQDNSNYFSFKEVSKSELVDVYKDYPVNPIEIKYEDNTVKISGLKDKNVEEKVNKKLSVLDSTEDEYGNNSCYTNFNVSNVLSVTCETKSVNVNLVNGNDIILEEIFQKDSDIYSMLWKALYDSYCSWGGCDSYDEIDNEYPNDIENVLAKEFNKIRKGDYSFTLTYLGVALDIIEYEYPWILFSDTMNNTTIYNRFLTEEHIYENKVTKYCNPQNCDIVTDDKDENNYVFKDFLNDNNYLNFNVYNNTDRDIFNNESIKQNYNMEVLGEKLKNEFINKYSLDEVNNYRNIYITAGIYNNDNNGNKVIYTITITELNKENFKKSILYSELIKKIKEKEITKVNMILDSKNNISYLNEEPSTKFANFEVKTYEYIINNLEKEEYSDFYLYYNCEFAYDYEECEKNKNYHNLIKEAKYAVDDINKRIHIYHAIPGIGTYESYVNTYIPFDIYENDNNEAIIPTE